MLSYSGIIKKTDWNLERIIQPQMPDKQEEVEVMFENDARELLLGRVQEYIQLKQEGTNWDFKKEWYKDKQKSEMLIDIICMANLTDNVDGMIIIGVDEQNDYCVSGVENDPNRKKTQDLVCFLREKKFAGSIRPIVSVVSFNIDAHIIDVIVVKNSANTPFYLSERYNDIEAYHIYTRVMDTNTPKNSSADLNLTEALWKKRFGIGATAVERLTIYLKNADDWNSIDGEMSFFNKYYPEFTIEHEMDETRKGYEYYLFSQIDSRPRWYNVYVRCHQTLLYHTIGVALDGGRYFTAVPEYNCFHSLNIERDIWFYSYTDESFQYLLANFFNNKAKSSEALSARRKYSECVPVFNSQQEKKDFLKYAANNFSRERDFATYRYNRMPSFPKTLPSGQMVSAFKEEYHDALIICDLLDEFRMGRNNLPSELNK